MMIAVEYFYFIVFWNYTTTLRLTHYILKVKISPCFHLLKKKFCLKLYPRNQQENTNLLVKMLLAVIGVSIDFCNFYGV